MTRLFLAAGVAALAIAAPTAAKPGGGQGGPHGGQQQAQNQGGPRGGAQAQRGRASILNSPIRKTICYCQPALQLLPDVIMDSSY